MKKMTEKEERIETIVAGIRSMLMNAKVWNVEFQCGSNRWAGIGATMYKLRPTGGYTVTIDIDGGGHDTETPMGDIRNVFPEYGS